MSTPNEVISYEMMSLDILYASYLPFVNNGAIFVPSDMVTDLGDMQTVSVTLPDSTRPITFKGKIVWVNYKQQANRPAGFAVQMGNNDIGRGLKHEIERLLAGQTGSNQSTYTM